MLVYCQWKRIDDKKDTTTPNWIENKTTIIIKTKLVITMKQLKQSVILEDPTEILRVNH